MGEFELIRRFFSAAPVRRARLAADGVAGRGYRASVARRSFSRSRPVNQVKSG